MLITVYFIVASILQWLRGFVALVLCTKNNMTSHQVSVVRCILTVSVYRRREKDTFTHAYRETEVEADRQTDTA